MPPTPRPGARPSSRAVRFREQRGPAGPSARRRFRDNDAYRAAREWQRYEGTAQRDLFRELRERFLERHRAPARWVLDAGSGPGRFTGRLGPESGARRVALDLGREMLLELRDRGDSARPGEAAPELVRGDAERPAFRPGAFDVVAALGNLLGFAGDGSDRVLAALTELVAPGGMLFLEVAPGAGERSRYLSRLPASAVGRLFRSGPSLLTGRIDREGFARERSRKSGDGEFRRIEPPRLVRTLEGAGFGIREVLAVAPALGADPARTAAVAQDAKAWGHLLEVEERIGRSPARWGPSAAVLLAAVRRRPGAPAAESEG